MKTCGLILEGGGMRGAYTAGALDALLDMGIHIKDVIGVSAGAANSMAYLSDQRGRNLVLYKRFAPDDKYLSLKNMLTTGSYFGMHYVFFEVTSNILPYNYADYRKSDKRLTSVSTDVKTGKAFYKYIDDFEDETQMTYVMSSAAIPLFSNIVKVEGHKLMDGSAADSIPIEYSISKGNEKNIVILTRNKGYRAKESFLPKLAYLRYAFYRDFAKTVATRHIYYNKSLDIVEKEEQEGRAVAIYPTKPITISRFEKNPDNLVKLYEEGLADTMAKKDELLKFVADCDNVSVEIRETVPMVYGKGF